VKSALAITPNTTDFVAEVAASGRFERSSILAVAKTKGGCIRQSTGGRPTKTSSQGKPLDQDANALISTRYVECAEKHAAKLQGMIGHAFAKRMTDVSGTLLCPNLIFRLS
jgi:hypothetical protein